MEVHRGTMHTPDQEDRQTNRFEKWTKLEIGSFFSNDFPMGKYLISCLKVSTNTEYIQEVY